MIICSKCKKPLDETSVDDGTCSACGGALMDSNDPITPQDFAAQETCRLIDEINERLTEIKRLKG